MAEYSSDIIFIGAGPGGYEVAAELAAAGKAVTVVEKDLPGGTCLNRGCIPTKCLAAAAARLLEIAGDSDFGITVSKVSADYGRAHARAAEITASLRSDIASALSAARYITGEARFIDNSHIAVGSDVFTAPRIVIATGSKPVPLRCAGGERAISSDQFLALDSLPSEPVVIVGGGVIGLEFASILNAYGVKTTVVEYCREVLPGVDAELAKRLRSALKRRGVEILTGTAVEEITGSGTVKCTTAKGPVELAAGTVIAAVGRRPVVPEGLENTSVRLTDRGFIAVDKETMATDAPGIYAVGDVNGLTMLAHAASAQARRACGLPALLSPVPAVVFTVPELATVGATEGITAKVPYSANGKALAEGAEGLLKLVADPDTHRITGCHVLGPHAADLVAEATIAIARGTTAAELASVIHAHPSLSELLATAARKIG